MGEPSLDDANVKVAVRVRPMNRRGEGAALVGFVMVPLALRTNPVHGGCILSGLT